MDLTSEPTGQCSRGNYRVHHCYDPQNPVYEYLSLVGCSGAMVFSNVTKGKRFSPGGGGQVAGTEPMPKSIVG